MAINIIDYIQKKLLNLEVAYLKSQGTQVLVIYIPLWLDLL